MCQLLGYSKEELLNKHITILMSNVDASNHDDFLKRYLTSTSANIFQKDRLIFPKLKSGYIIPVYAMVKPAQQLRNGV